MQSVYQCFIAQDTICLEVELSPANQTTSHDMKSFEDVPSLERSQHHVLQASFNHIGDVLPAKALIEQSTTQLLSSLPSQPWGIERTTDHLLDTVVPALNRSSLSPNYYGFVIGGATPAARVADTIVSAYDQNVSFHLPDQSIATTVEDRALRMLLDLLQFDANAWTGRTFTTGATASNVLGILSGREHVVNAAVERHIRGPLSSQKSSVTVGNDGLLAACMVAKIDEIQILTTLPHSSLIKACSVAGLGRSSVVHVGRTEDSIEFDLNKLEAHLQRANTASIVAISCGEVNTGFFATQGIEDVQKIRVICDKYTAWLHVDAGMI